MFIFRINKKVLMGLCVCVAAAAAVLLGNGVLSAVKAVTTSAGMQITLRAKSEADRQKFLADLGLQNMSDPKEVSEVQIPAQFDEVYQSYNELQQKSGFDLSKYRGKTVKKYLYQNETHMATLLVYKGKIIGGDLTPAGENATPAPLFEKTNNM